MVRHFLRRHRVLLKLSKHFFKTFCTIQHFSRYHWVKKKFGWLITFFTISRPSLLRHWPFLLEPDELRWCGPSGVSSGRTCLRRGCTRKGWPSRGSSSGDTSGRSWTRTSCRTCRRRTSSPPRARPEKTHQCCFIECEREKTSKKSKLSKRSQSLHLTEFSSSKLTDWLLSKS